MLVRELTDTFIHTMNPCDNGQDMQLIRICTLLPVMNCLQEVIAEKVRRLQRKRAAFVLLTQSRYKYTKSIIQLLTREQKQNLSP